MTPAAPSLTHPQPLIKFSGYQKFVVALLAFLQFSIILDFMIISPLGAVVMPALKITPSQFGVIVSVYAFSAGISGLLAAGFADRFDRKKLLLFFYVGFILGTFLCGLASTYQFLLFARMITGIFGGVIGSITLAIATDIFQLEMRGRVMGFIQTAFGASQVLGLPAGLFLSNLWGWHAPFFMIVGISTMVAGLIAFYLRPVDEHLKLQVKENPLVRLWGTVWNPKYTLAFCATALLSLGGFMLMPFGSAFTVHNVGIGLDKLPMVYLVTGISSIFLGPLIGRASDAFGKFNTFLFGGCLSIVMVLIYTSRGETSLPVWILINVVMFTAIFSRMIPSQALMSAIPDPAHRGSFMSVSSSLQQISGGLGSVVAGLIVLAAPDGKILNFDKLGYIIIGTGITTMVLMYFVHRSVPEHIRGPKRKRA